MRAGLRLRRYAVHVLVLIAGVLMVAGVRTYLRFRPAAITLGPNTTVYFREDPAFVTRVHEAIHRRQMKDKSTVGRVLNALAYSFDYGYRLDEEAEAKAGEICLQIHRFSSELPAYTTARSISQARAYRAWTWERMGLDVPDRVGRQLAGGENCHRILRGVTLDLPPGEPLTESDALKLATFRFLQAYGSTEREVRTWKARLELAGYAEPAHWDVPEDVPPFGLQRVGRTVAAGPDTAITPAEAGRALHRLTYYTAERMYTQLKPALPGYRGRPLAVPGEAEERVGVPLEDWPQRLLEKGLAGEFDEGQLLWLQGLAAHPLHRDFHTFALAPTADIVGERYRFPFEDRWSRIVLSDIGPIREAFRAQWGRAALAAHQGDLDGAADVLRTVAAGALQIVENAPFEVDVVEGLDFLELALAGLLELDRYRRQDTPWLEEYRRVSPATWMKGARTVLFSEDPDEIYRALPALANDPGIPHAFKRFAYRQVLLTDVCLENHWEAGETREAHRRWRAAVEIGLVRRESDRRVIELMRSSVRDLLAESAVPPTRICSPSTGMHPDARIAIMAAPLRRTMALPSQD